jgi:hypothetical protein
MNVRFVAVCFSLGLMIASPQAFAQRFGEFLVGGGWSTQRHGAPAASLPAERAGDFAPLAQNLAKLLPSGTDLRSAASGFASLGDFVAALYVSKNLQVSFADLKAKIVGGSSLGSAIAAMRPDTDSQIEARKGRAAAYEELARV